MKYHIQTYGCQMNYSDSERVAAVLEKSGYQKAKTLEEVDLFIFNTCSIRQKGEDRVHGMINNIASYKRSNPRLLIGVTGCMIRKSSTRNSEKKDQVLQRHRTRLDFVFNIKDTHKLPQILAEAEPQLELEALDHPDYLKIKPAYSKNFQAFVPIQIGCDKYCTYCIVPYSRGREQSRPFAEIIEECNKLVENGCLEITLVGQTVNTYGRSNLDQDKFADLKPSPFAALLKEIDKLKTKGLNRIRYTSPHPRDLDDALIEAHASLSILAPHIHLPIQAGDNQVLQKMNRKYTVEEYTERISRLKQRVPHIRLTTDIIVGFCGETEEQFQNTLRVYQDLQWDQAYIARYSERSGTVADKCFPDDVPTKTKSDRWHQLNDLMEEISLRKNRDFEGQNLEVLVESYNPLTKECEGRSREFKLVQFPGQPENIGQIQHIEIIQGLEWVLKGKQVV